MASSSLLLWAVIYCLYCSVECNTQQFAYCLDNKCVCEEHYSLQRVAEQVYICTGTWGEWVDGLCSEACGEGVLFSQRECLDNVFCYDEGDWHAGQIVQKSCKLKECDCDGGCNDSNAQCVDNECVCKPFYQRISVSDQSTICSGVWGAWEAGACSKTCGPGVSTWKRTCQQGAVCYADGFLKGEEEQVNDCNNGPCGGIEDCEGGCGMNAECVDKECQCKDSHYKTSILGVEEVCAGIWNDWVDSACLAACGDSFTTSTRTCRDGAFCYTTNGWVTAETKIVPCKNRDCGCLDNGCEDTNAECIGNHCACKEHYSKVNVSSISTICSGEWSDWKSSECSQPCGLGEQTKTRTCLNGAKCFSVGEMKRTDDYVDVCLIKPCDTMSWDEWRNNGACSQTTCTVSQIRECLTPAGNVCEGDDDLDGKEYRTVECYDGVCNTADVDGGWSDYSPDSECSVECGNGVQTRVKVCNNPSRHNNGLFCPGDVNNDGVEYQTSPCFKDPCPIDGKWGNWQTSGCTKTCGGGVSIRYRACDSPAPQFGGQLCNGDEDGVETENIACNEQACKVDGGWGEYGTYGECSNECGGGLQFSYAYCDSPAPSGTGAACSGDDLGYKMLSRSCNDVPCLDPIHGVWSDWSDWACSNQCISTRKRECSSPPPAYGGLFCAHDERIQHYGMDEYEINCCGDVCTKYESQCTENDNCILNNDGVCICIDTYNFNYLSCNVTCDILKSEIFDPDQGKCVCQSQYIKNSDDVCILKEICKENEVYNDNDLKCACKEGYVRDSEDNICKSLPGCTNDDILNPNTGQCEPGWFVVTPCVTPCSGNAKYRNGLDFSIPPLYLPCNNCPTGAFCSSGECQCIEGHKKNSVGTCINIVPCESPHTKFDIEQGGCVCDDSYVENSTGSCIQGLTCTKVNTIFNADQVKCVCVPGYVEMASGSCTPKLTCSLNEEFHVESETCVCKTNYVENSDDECVFQLTCNKTNSEFIADEKACVCISGYIDNTVGSACVQLQTCSANSEFNPDQEMCVCSSGYINNNNDECVLEHTCSDNQQIDSNTLECECKIEYVRNSTGECIFKKSCNENEEFNVDSQICESQCGSDELLNPITNLCEMGWFVVAPCVSPCSGRSKYRNSHDFSIPPLYIPCNNCPTGEFCTSQECACKFGHVKDTNGVCVLKIKCTAENTQFHPEENRCVCKSGFHLDQNSLCVSKDCAEGEIFNPDIKACEADWFELEACSSPCSGNAEYFSLNTYKTLDPPCDHCKRGLCVNDVCTCENNSTPADGRC